VLAIRLAPDPSVVSPMPIRRVYADRLLQMIAQNLQVFGKLFHVIKVHRRHLCAIIAGKFV
jgi:hypothetical protein